MLRLIGFQRAGVWISTGVYIQVRYSTKLLRMSVKVHTLTFVNLVDELPVNIRFTDYPCTIVIR